MAAAEPLRPALAVSVVLHVALLGLAIFVGAHSAARRAQSSLDGSASWAGDTLDIDGLVASRAGGAPEAPPATEPAAEAPVTAAPPAEPEAPKLERAPVKHHRTAAAASASAPAAAPAASAASSGAQASEGAPGSPGTGPSAGTSGAPTGITNLAKAFTKAVTAATSRDPLWDELPLGTVGSARVEIKVDDEGRITSSALDDREHVSEPLRRLVERTLLLLQAGRFAIDRGELHAGSQKLRIAVTLSAGEPAEDYDDPRHVVSLGFDPPTPSGPGKAYFVHASGRHFEAKIWLDGGA